MPIDASQGSGSSDVMCVKVCMCAKEKCVILQTGLLETLNNKLLDQHTHQLSDLRLDESRDGTPFSSATEPLPLRQHHHVIICDLM